MENYCIVIGQRALSAHDAMSVNPYKVQYIMYLYILQTYIVQCHAVGLCALYLVSDKLPAIICVIVEVIHSETNC